MVPPPYLGKTFDGTHTHYLTSASTVIDSQDIEDMIHHVREHGYGTTVGSQFLIFAHPDDVEAATMTAWRAGIEYRTGGPATQVRLHPECPYAGLDFATRPVHGPVPTSNYNGLQVWGSYAGALLIQSNFVPKGWVAVAASDGPNCDLNPIGMREHSNSAYQGLRHIPGHWQGLPVAGQLLCAWLRRRHPPPRRGDSLPNHHGQPATPRRRRLRCSHDRP